MCLTFDYRQLLFLTFSSESFLFEICGTCNAVLNRLFFPCNNIRNNKTDTELNTELNTELFVSGIRKY